MDVGTVVEVTGLSRDHVTSVMRRLNNEPEKMERAIGQYLESKSGPLQEVQEFNEVATKGNKDANAWSENKPRRAKKGLSLIHISEPTRPY